MSLSEAVLDIVAEMEKSASDSADKAPLTWATVRLWTLALKSAAKAEKAVGFANPRSLYIDPLVAAKASTGHLKREDRLGDRMVRCVGGNCDGDYISIDPNMPVDAYTAIGDQSYQLTKDGNLTYAPN